MRAKVRLVVQVLCISLLQVLVGSGRTAQAQGHDAAAPKVSRFAPADDLARQAEYYVKQLENSVASKDEYKDDQEKLTKDASTLAVIALALGMHDQANAYKDRAAALIKAAQAAAATKDYESAQKAVAGVRAAADGKSTVRATLKWEPVAALSELMKQVPVIDTKLKRLIQGAKFKTKAKETEGYTAVIAAIGQASIADLSATKKPGQIKQWQTFATTMRDRAGAVNAAIHKQDRAATTAAMTKLAQSCEDCHKVFKPEAEKPAK